MDVLSRRKAIPGDENRIVGNKKSVLIEVGALLAMELNLLKFFLKIKSAGMFFDDIGEPLHVFNILRFHDRHSFPSLFNVHTLTSLI
jgi:hypothetical protein